MSHDLPALVAELVAKHAGDRGALLPILHDIQRELGHVDPACVPLLAQALNMSRADVHGVVSFYHDFRDQPAGATHVRVCRAEACQAVGAEALAAHARQRLGVGIGETGPGGPGGTVTFDQVFCFGNCALGPTVEVDGRLHGRVDAERFDQLLAAVTT